MIVIMKWFFRKRLHNL